MVVPTRGFVGRGHAARDPRLPPGQYDSGADFPVLTAEVTPRIDPADWSLTVDGAVTDVVTWTWDDLQRAEQSQYRGDIHCVTTWSKLDTSFGGVSLDLLLAQAQPLSGADFVLASASSGYSANLPLADVTGGKAWLATSHEGRPLHREHGGPVRLLVPHLYFWKSVKWLTRITVLGVEELGFWERNGYHYRGDPWKEQRYQGDGE